MEVEYLEQFEKMRKISSSDFLREKSRVVFFNIPKSTNDKAFMNYRMDGSVYEQFISMYEGYAEASLFLLDDCIKNNYSFKKDIWMFPIFFDIVHALELFLKATNYILKGTENNSENEIDITEGGHNILAISQNVKTKIKQSTEFKNFSSDFELIHEFINIVADMFKITEVDKNTFIAPRYPITKNKIPYNYVEQNKKIPGTNFLADESFTIEMSNLKIWLLKIYQICEDFNMFIEESFTVEN